MLESLVGRQRAESRDLLMVLLRWRFASGFVVRARVSQPFDLVFEKGLPLRALFDRLQPNGGNAGRKLDFDGEPAATGARHVAHREGQIRPLQSVTRQARFPAHFGPNSGDLSPASRQTPAFEE